MNHPESFPPPFCLHHWLIQPDLNRISGDDGPVQIEPRVMAVLLALAEQPGELVTRLDLLDRVWGDTVVGEEILTRAISELRRVFGDQARQPAYIETIRNNGYRLIAPVTPPPIQAEPEPEPDPRPKPDATPAPEAAPSTVPPPSRKGGSWLRLLIVAIVLVAVALLGPAWLRRDQATDPDPYQVPVAVPLTSYPGREYHPALSADGTRVAFAWSG
ncbi:MAG: winged helix-turn-helix domain-containing protein, partial [Candidatus Krumholzibacteria bacterium]|nr:winged helix-turn-helix domain-containing protein [Candidatus Krumholzibacteria bacterium]